MHMLFLCSECVNRFSIPFYYRGRLLKTILKLLVILSMEKTMVDKVISELKSISRLFSRFFQKLETGLWCVK